MKKIIFLAVSLLIIFLTSCSDFSLSPIGEHMEYITIESGEILKISLESNPTTGYKWIIAYKPDESILEIVKHYYDLNKRPKVGEGGNENWELKGGKNGITKIVFIYKRPWESRGVKKEEYHIVVIK